VARRTKLGLSFLYQPYSVLLHRGARLDPHDRQYALRAISPTRWSGGS